MLLGLNVIMPFLEVVSSLLKFAQLCDVFVCDFIAMVEICEGDIYWMYCDNHSCFQDDVFGNSHALINFAHENNKFRWITNFNIRIYHEYIRIMVFEFVRQHI